ncbi:hydantoinase/oxoprolinase N-terminal domain-containing protein [Corynebacterium meridianum]|uniref:Hydantoinase/oxoprolinase N-terminal domain-containing protein n=1 Tax=Corynebacterium meridianum TaxID=2765363 RepID=A0A934I1I2_9CORY|nr:hypothetical protein [Corynebacterium meridianum]
MKHLINIDNGGTLTDVCVWDGDQFSFTKTLTTPFDLSECLFEGIAKASANLYDERDLVRLLHEAEHIRYSTTQGTNALVERKGRPKLKREFSLPLTGTQVVDRVITDLAVFDITEREGMVLRELAPGVSLAEIEESTEAAFTVRNDDGAPRIEGATP